MPGTATPRNTRTRAKAKAAAVPAKTVETAAPAAPEPDDVDRFDILEALAITGGEPQPITLLGVEADVRRTFTGEEAAVFHGHLAANRLREAIDVITDGSGQAIWDAVAHLPADIVAKLINKVIALSGLSEGELRPLSPPSSARMAGAVRSQAYADGMASISEQRSANSTGETAAG
ncbi:hypothetical protein M1M07_07730 [Rhodococcus sp. HM1]|uniref:hypothetical protein n=1 Tax=Rhodococcus sp. HM1 TaxID=2937759 RepID=UPI00200A2B0E|nr:hypothetical protein [Rhodococcus sp. HM1]MCK8671007.1 hypothetical protein [Rhodococcus sp. HM1]